MGWSWAILPALYIGMVPLVLKQPVEKQYRIECIIVINSDAFYSAVAMVLAKPTVCQSNQIIGLKGPLVKVFD